ncbi:type III-B CRISPR module RAMP protein Cmr4 [Thermoflavimicrobium dichotomicum]|uniref:CRISPR-associated protein Cmr4 n=1 Tax=Thermoflavimicrobium dichotomicum TaxID=46223 RepID=A0A1I3UUY0_9BACL|nr:type III-B CRISPR module RAMP protein Cmr4 [Thermoflavimicrobium dichotomicum]SFJ85651.1 CRISPR-associated protein Cmr4 [Thermoflavimicrobium dichotomicum]
MKQALVGLLAETSIHVGAGQQSGFVDLPVIREQTTMVPYIPASSLKGALREKLNQDLQDKNEEEEKINAQLDLYFGNKNQAGSIGITDGRLLLLPFRSLNQPYYLVTCPFLLQRFSRDLQFAGGTKLKWVEQLKEMARPIMAKKEPFIYLEEFYYEPQANPQLIQQLIQAISPLIAHEEIQSQLTQQLVILPDREFRLFRRIFSAHPNPELSRPKE